MLQVGKNTSAIVGWPCPAPFVMTFNCLRLRGKHDQAYRLLQEQPFFNALYGKPRWVDIAAAVSHLSIMKMYRTHIARFFRAFPIAGFYPPVR